MGCHEFKIDWEINHVPTLHQLGFVVYNPDYAFLLKIIKETGDLTANFSANQKIGLLAVTKQQ